MTTLTQVSATQANKEVTINDVLEAVSPAGLFGVKRELTTGLTFAYFGGVLFADGVASAIADGTVALTASTTNYIERTAAGVVSKNTSGFSPEKVPLYTAVTSTSGITTLTDYRQTTLRSFGRLSIDIGGSPSGYVLSGEQAMADELIFTGVLGGDETVTLPTVRRRWWVYNSTTGSYTLTFKTASGTGVYLPSGYKAALYCDGTNILMEQTFLARGATLNGDLVLTNPGTGRILISTDGYVQASVEYVANADAYLALFGAAAGSNPRLGVSSRNLVLGTGAELATNAVEGHILIPTCNGTATGAVTGAAAGQVPMIYDRSANKLGVLSGGTWRWTAALT